MQRSLQPLRALRTIYGQATNEWALQDVGHDPDVLGARVWPAEKLGGKRSSLILRLVPDMPIQVPISRSDVMRSWRVFVLAVMSAASVSAIADDAPLAAKLKADDEGMRTYVMAFLKAGPNRERPPEEAQQLQAAHRDIRRLAAEGKLVLAGPFGDAGPLRGIYIFDVATVAEAEALTADRSRHPGRPVGDGAAPADGLAALMMVNDVHARIQKPRP